MVKTFQNKLVFSSLFVSFLSPSFAAMTVKFENVEGDLVISWSGTLDISHLTEGGTFSDSEIAGESRRRSSYLGD